MSLRRHSKRHGFSTLSEINVTPLLDLAFVLLIIFMITTPLMDKSVDLVIPSSEAAKNAVNPALVQTVAINKEAVIKLNDEQVTLDELQAKLVAMGKTSPGIAVVIRSHKELPVQKLVDVMSALERAGITKVGVVTNPEAE